MRPQQIIAKKRDGGVLSAEDIDAFINGVCDSTWADYQISALMMAMFINGLDDDEQNKLTHAMLHSGEVLDFSEIDAPKADKHSTGGVGDKTSLIIAPLVASCGLAVPMISGRGLGHTGGTLDKLESIPGYNVHLSTDQFRSIIEKCGFAMTGQTADIAPADKKLYALRDATATVPYIPLIVGSIMSKKLAEGLDALVLDVKTGSGAFMKTLDDSRRLAEALVKTGREFGVRTQAVVSDMSQPLGKFAGNSVEVYECIKILRGEFDDAMGSTRELSVELSARMLILSGVAADIVEGRRIVSEKLADGSALEKFRQNVELQGGDPKVCDEPQRLLETGLMECVVDSVADGIITEIDTFKIGSVLVDLGGGRVKAEDKVDPSVGFCTHVRVGTGIRRGEPLGIAACRNADQADRVRDRLRSAFTVSSDVPVVKPKLVQAIIGE
ncbi:MAG TPA: thymidine phosphorylase [Pyrinomonadaceae bacterium]|jgi:pyrimidine-nucleoside phosphorylase